MLVGDEVGDFVLHVDNGGQNREDGFLAGLHLLVEHFIHLPVGEQAGRSEDDAHAVDVVEVVLAGVDDVAELFGGASGEEVDGVAHGGATEELGKQLVGLRAFDVGNVHAVVRQHVGKHHGGAAGVGDDGHVLAFHLGVHEDGAHGGEFLAVVAAHDAGFAEKGIDGCVVGGEGAGMRRGGAAASGGTTRLDGCNLASFVDERARVLQQLLRVTDFLHIKHDDAGRFLWIEGGVEVFKDVLDTHLGGVTDGPNTVESKTIGDTVLLDEDGGGTRAGHEIHAVRVEGRDGGVESTAVVGVEEAGAVGPDEAAAHAVDGVGDVLLVLCALLALFAKTSGHDVETAGVLLLRQDINGGGTVLGGDGQNGAIHFRQIFHLGVAMDALNLRLFRIHGIYLAFERT